MGLSTVLKAKPREVKNNNHVGRLRAQGLLPAIFYGPGIAEPKSLTLNYNDFKNAFLGGEGNRSLYTLDIEGFDSGPVLLKDYQIDPMSRKMMHVDFYKVDSDKPITVKVPVVLYGKPVGVEKGGQMSQGEREVNITALPSQIPAELKIDISALGLGHSLHFSQVPVPEGLKLTYVADLPVATVALPKGIKAETEAAAAESAVAPAAAPAAPAKGKK